jgi:DNA-binding MarR family transcriptional regulator
MFFVAYATLVEVIAVSSADPRQDRLVFNVPVRRLAARLTVLMQREVLTPAGLRIQEWRVLWSLAREGETHLRELARRASVDASHVSRLAGKLENEGLIERKIDAQDARRLIFAITGKGMALYEEVRPKAIDVSRQFRDLYTEQEYDTLMDLLERAIRHADEVMEGHGIDAANEPE